MTSATRRAAAHIGATARCKGALTAQVILVNAWKRPPVGGLRSRGAAPAGRGARPAPFGRVTRPIAALRGRPPRGGRRPFGRVDAWGPRGPDGGGAAPNRGLR